jgi:WD40 repeat protein
MPTTYWRPIAMTRLYFVSVAVTVAFFSASATAAPAPKEAPVTPISAENASQVKPILEVPKTANRIVRGPNRGALILFDRSSTAEVVDDITLRPIRTLLKDRRPTDLAVSADGKLVAFMERNSSGYTVRETDGDKSFEIEIGGNPGYAAFSPDGKLLAIGFTHWAQNAGEGYSETRLYDLKGKLVRTLEKTGAGAVHPVFSPDGKTLAVGNRNYETQLFDVATGKLLHKLDRRMTQEVAFRPDGKVLAEGYVDGSVGLWDVATGKLLQSEASGCKEIYSMDWSPKGDVLATCGREGKIILWEPGKLTRLKELDAPFWVILVRFTADGGRLLTSSAADYGGPADRKVVVWSVPGGAGR